MDLDLARDIYFRELDSRAQLDSRLGVFVALLSLLGGLLAVLVRWSWPLDSALRNLALGIDIAAGVGYVLAIVLILRTVGLDYLKLPDSDQLLAYRRELDAYFAAYPTAEGSPSADFDDYLLRQFSRAATANSQNNIKRSQRFYEAAMVLLCVVLAAAASAALLGIDQLVARGGG